MKNIQKIIQSQIESSVSMLKLFNKNHLLIIETIINHIFITINKNKKIFLIGNGGSAAQCQHFSAELVVKFKKQRKGIAAISLSTDTSILTACSNDFNYKYIFKRQLEAISQKGDLLIAFSTSGKSKNILEALNFSKKAHLKTIFITSESCKYKNAQIVLKVPSIETSRIQEAHLLIIHILCELIDLKIK
jgi:D-sedoheptulose 7-phosphate isomerase